MALFVLVPALVINCHDGGSIRGSKGIYNTWEKFDGRANALEAWVGWLAVLIHKSRWIAGRLAA